MKDIKRLFKYLRPYKRSIYLSLLCNALTAIFTVVSIPLIMPFFQILFGQAEKGTVMGGSGLENMLRTFFLDIIQNYSSGKALLIVCFLIVASFLLKNLFRYLSLLFMIPTRTGVIYDLRSMIFQRLVYSPLSFYKKHKKGDLMTRISADTQEIEWSILQFLQVLVQSPLIIIGSLVFMLLISPSLTLVVFFLMLVIGFVLGNISKTLKKQSSSMQAQLSKIMATVDETTSGILSIKSFKSEKNWTERFELSNQNYKNEYARFLKRRDLSSPLSEFLGIFIVAILLWWGSNMVLANAIAPETFFAFILAFYFVIEPLKSFSSAFYNLKKGMAALDRIEELNINQSTADLDNLTPSSTFDLHGDIVIRNLSYKFEDTDEFLIKNLDLTIEQGKMTALVGPSGSGKTSLLMLLLKIYKPTEGTILVNGNDIQNLDTHQWMSNLGFVPQEPFLFNDSLSNNIYFGRKADKEKLNNAIQLSNSEDFVNAKELQSDYGVGDKGDKLSGGEKQRINIARALFDDPSLLLMDEPTSSLDAGSEQKINEAIQVAAKQRTSVIIAHRISTIKNADKIVLLEHGKIVDEGNHESLLASSELYKKYVKLQLT